MFSASFSRLVIAVLFATSVLGATVPSSVVHERRDAAPASFVHVGPAPADQTINMRINLAMNDRDGLQQALMAAATPGSPTFRQWLSKEQVSATDKPVKFVLLKPLFIGRVVCVALCGDEKRGHSLARCKLDQSDTGDTGWRLDHF
jgi:hypothetical protein